MPTQMERWSLRVSGFGTVRCVARVSDFMHNSDWLRNCANMGTARSGVYPNRCCTVHNPCIGRVCMCKMCIVWIWFICADTDNIACNQSKNAKLEWVRSVVGGSRCVRLRIIRPTATVIGIRITIVWIVWYVAEWYSGMKAVKFIMLHVVLAHLDECIIYILIKCVAQRTIARKTCILRFFCCRIEFDNHFNIRMYSLIERRWCVLIMLCPPRRQQQLQKSGCCNIGYSFGICTADLCRTNSIIDWWLKIKSFAPNCVTPASVCKRTVYWHRHIIHRTVICILNSINAVSVLLIP